jgi:hypothetical protein
MQTVEYGGELFFDFFSFFFILKKLILLADVHCDHEHQRHLLIKRDWTAAG